MEIIFLSSTEARVNTVLSLATSEGWKEKMPKFSHLWAPETDTPKNKSKIKILKCKNKMVPNTFLVSLTVYKK